MKKLRTVTAIIAVLGSALMVNASEMKAQGALSTLKAQGVTGVTSIERKGDTWFVRYGNNETKQISASSASSLASGTETFMPLHKVSVEGLIKRSLADEKGSVSKVEYRNRKVIVKITNGPDDYYFTYDQDGNRVGKQIF